MYKFLYVNYDVSRNLYIFVYFNYKRPQELEKNTTFAQNPPDRGYFCRNVRVVVFTAVIVFLQST